MTTRFVASTAILRGDIELGDETNIWDYVVVRADTARVTIGPGTNLQEGVIVHVSPAFGCSIGSRVTVGHRAVLHGCTIGDDALIGIGAIVLNDAEVGAGSIVAAGAVVTEGMRIPSGSLVAGVPARIVGPVDEGARQRAERVSAAYRLRARVSLPALPGRTGQMVAARRDPADLPTSRGIADAAVESTTPEARVVAERED